MNAIQDVPTTAPSAASMSLFDLDAELQALMETAAREESESGKMTPETEAQLVLYFGATVKKVDRICEFIKQLSVVSSATKAEKARLDARFKSEEAAVDRTKAMVLRFMEERGLLQIKGRLNTVSRCNNSVDSLVIDDEMKIPDEWRLVSLRVSKDVYDAAMAQAAMTGELSLATGEFMPVGNPEVDESGIRKALLGSTDVPGCRLVRGQHIRLR